MIEQSAQAQTAQSNRERLNAYRFQAEHTWEEVAAYADLPLADVEHAGRRGDLTKLLYEARPDLFERSGQ